MSQEKLKEAIKRFDELRGTLQTHRQTVSMLATQQHENEQVLKELSAVEDDAIVYKMIGAVLVKQSRDDARSVVEKRLDYIRREVERADRLVTSIQNDLRESALKVEDLKQEVIESQKKVAPRA